MKGKIGLVALVATVTVFVILFALGRRWTTVTVANPQGDSIAVRVAFAADRCVSCHSRTTPSIVQQWATSNHARNRVTCSDCHVVEEDSPGAIAHEGTYVVSTVTPYICGSCHHTERRQFELSRHSLPAWTALVGYDSLPPHFQEMFNRITEVRRDVHGGEIPTGFIGATRNALFDIEGKTITRFACESCHQIGRPNADGSAGNCNTCHLRHSFSLEQVRKPETCNRCHIGPDHPQWEIYEESTHGILYHTLGHNWNWSQAPGRLTVRDFPAPTCQICHMSGFGGQPTTHDVGDRLSWFLYAETSSRRPGWRENVERMKAVCAPCHGETFVDRFYQEADSLTEAVNQWTTRAGDLMRSLYQEGVITKADFDVPIKFQAFDLWHFWGRTAKFGAWMGGPDYTQWHGIYELIKEWTSLREEADRLRAEHHRSGRGQTP